MKDALPGTLWVNSGRWNWRVRFPGDEKRKNVALKPPGHSVALAEEKGRDKAESLAWRIWEKETRRKRKAAAVFLDDVCGRFLSWAEGYYTARDGRCSELANCDVALRSLRARFGMKPIHDVTYAGILDLRERLVEAGLQRTTVNKYVGIWKRMFGWALENRLCDATTKMEVWAITSLKRNRTAAPEGKPVMPVRHKDVKATLPFMTPTVRAMVLLQELCGARQGEICAMRPKDIERKRGVWVYRPPWHKTESKGFGRVIVLGPRAQALLEPFLCGRPTLAVFSPQKATEERLGAMRSHRTTKVQPSQFDRRKPGARRRPGESYTGATYGRAVRYACRAAGKSGVVVDWSPNQLRHACGTRVRRKFGPDAARVVLGHSDGSRRITDRYTREAIEVEVVRTAARVMKRIG